MTDKTGKKGPQGEDAMDSWTAARGKRSTKAVGEVVGDMTGSTSDPLALKREQAMQRFEAYARLVIQNPSTDDITAVTLRVPPNLAGAANEWCAAHEFGAKRTERMFVSHICAELLTGFVMAMSDPNHREKFEALWARGEGKTYSQVMSEALSLYLGNE